MTQQDKARALQWVFDVGNPVLKLWAAPRLGISGAEQDSLCTAMLAHPPVRYWIDCLLAVAERPALHGSFDTCLENSMRKLALFGVREQDDQRLAAFCQGALERLEYRLSHPDWLNPVDATILASCLAAMGHDEPAVAAVLQERLDSGAAFAIAGDFEIHTDPAGYPTIPAARRGHPLIHPRFYPGNQYLYPLVYDLFAFEHLPASLATIENAGKIDDIIGSVLDERYQRLPYGYGLIFVPPNKYYGMGWSLHMPRFFGSAESRISTGGSVWWAEAMARYPAAARSGWFTRLMEHLDGFRTADGFWKFPASYLTEGPSHYAVGGGHMGLGEDRKAKDALKLESTAWMLRIEERLPGDA